MVPLMMREIKRVTPAPPSRRTVLRGGYFKHILISSWAKGEPYCGLSQTYAKGLYDDGTKSCRRAVGQGDGKDHEHVEVCFGIGERLTYLFAFDGFVLDTNLLETHPLNGDDLEPLRQESCLDRAIRENEPK